MGPVARIPAMMPYNRHAHVRFEDFVKDVVGNSVEIDSAPSTWVEVIMSWELSRLLKGFLEFQPKPICQSFRNRMVMRENSPDFGWHFWVVTNLNHRRPTAERNWS